MSTLLLEPETIDRIRDIVGTESVLTDVEDLYVYSFSHIYRDRQTPHIQAVIKTKIPEQIEKVRELSRDSGFLLVRHGERVESKRTKPIVILDDFEDPVLQPLQPSTKTPEKWREFLEAESGTPKKLVLAQELLLLNKPTSKCEECGTCGSYCTVAPSLSGIETWSAKGRMLLTKGMIAKDLSVSPKLRDVIYTCTNCGLCFAQCLDQTEFQKAIRAARRHIVVEGLAPPALDAMARNILEVGDPSAASLERRLSWMNAVAVPRSAEGAEVLYWVGCTLATRTPQAALAMANVLGLSDVDYSLLGKDEGCCGYPLLASGLWDEAKENATRLLERVRSSGAEIMVTSCAGCYYTFSQLFPEILDVEVPCALVHSSEFIEKLLEEGRVNVGNVEERVTFHDPCSLGRHSNVYDPPRNVLRSIPGLEFAEMSLNRGRARCCGGGGGLWSYNNRVSMNSALTRLRKDVSPTNVNVLATACPTCQMNLRYAAIRNAIPVKVCDFAEIVESAVFRASEAS